MLLQILSSQNVSTSTFGFISIQQVFLGWIMLDAICTFFFFLTYGSFRSLLLSLEIFEGFLAVLLLSVSNLILSCQITYSVISVLWSIFRLVLWHSICFIVVNVPLQAVLALHSAVLTEIHGYQGHVKLLIYTDFI